MNISLVRLTAATNGLVPLGFACLQAYLKKHGVDIRVFDLKSLDYDVETVLMDPSTDLVKFILNHLSFPLMMPLIEDIRNDNAPNFNSAVYRHLLAEIALRILELEKDALTRFQTRWRFVVSNVDRISKTDIVGFSIDYLSVTEAIMASALIKSNHPSKKVVWGGPVVCQSKADLKIFLQKKICDALVIGEGEKPLLELAQNVPLNQIDGLMMLDPQNREKLRYTPSDCLNLDDLPTPDYTDIDMKAYLDMYSVYTSRGCTNRCKFCGEHKMLGPKFRIRSIGRVVDDIVQIQRRHRPKYIIFGDSLLNHSTAYFEALCHEIRKRKIKLKFASHFRANFSAELARLARKTGFTDAWIGFEVFTEALLRDANKGLELERNLAVINTLSKEKIEVMAMLVVGFGRSAEELANYRAIIELIDTISNGNQVTHVNWRPSAYMLIPGSPNYESLKSDQVESWQPLIEPPEGIVAEISQIADQLSAIPYTFKRQTPDNIVSSMMRGIADAAGRHRFRSIGLNGYVAKKIALFQKIKRSPLLLKLFLNVSKSDSDAAESH